MSTLKSYSLKCEALEFFHQPRTRYIPSTAPTGGWVSRPRADVATEHLGQTSSTSMPCDPALREAFEQASAAAHAASPLLATFRRGTGSECPTHVLPLSHIWHCLPQLLTTTRASARSTLTTTLNSSAGRFRVRPQRSHCCAATLVSPTFISLGLG